jgi:pimeloyl-ACP methyl ester carboxylesterase
MRIKTEMFRRWRDDPTDRRLTEAMARVGIDAFRISPALLSLIAEEIERYRVPWRLDGALHATVSAFAAMTVDEGAVRAELARIEAPTLVVWGVRDRIIPRRVVDGLMDQHPAWDFRPVEGIGHLLPLEAPHTYVEIVADWMGADASVSLAKPRARGRSGRAGGSAPDRTGIPGRRSNRLAR